MDGLTSHTLEDTGEDEMDWSAESEECSSQHSLANSIQKSFVFSKFDTVPREYLPENIRNEMVTYVAIDEELKKGQREMPRCSDIQRERLAAWIYAEASKVFIITLLCDLGPRLLLQAMGCFKTRKFNDKCLPIDKPAEKSSLVAFPETIWSGLRLSRFYKDQWICLAPIFTSSTYSYDLPLHCILPFVKTGVASNKGAFSVVHKVEIHEHHQRHPQLGKVAIKEISIEHCDNHRETDKAWEIEARALEAINRLNHPHIVNCLAAIRRGEGRYFMFPWADGRSLRDLWDLSPEPNPSSQVIHNVIVQLRGLADALHRLHNFDNNSTASQISSNALAVQAVTPGVPSVYLPDEEDGDRVFTGASGSIRHGDLKPENILIFCNESNGFDTLKIADLGLAKQHVVATQERQNVTSMRFGTMRYEAPETVTALQGRSRLYDIWSMGCITLEYIIWILYGNKGLEKFYEQLKGSNPQMCQYFHTFTDPPRAEVRKVVIQWMDHIERSDPEGRRDSAIRDLLNIVRTRLLVVELNPRRQTVLDGKSMEPSPADPRSERYRATALEFRNGLDEILKKAQNSTYLFDHKPRGRIATPNTKSADHLSPTAALRPDGPLGPPRHFPSRPTENGNTERTIRENYALPHLKGWENPIDNEFAEQLFTRIGSEILSPAGAVNAKLCSQCRSLQFWTGGFSFEVETAKLQRQANNCDFCRLLYVSCTRDGLAPNGKIRFERNQSTIVMANHDSHPILSIFRSPGLKTPLPIQLGLPQLPQVKSDIFFEIIRSWLHDCNANHPDCEGVERESLPTRLIDVGNQQQPILRLVELREETIVSEEYVALSHPWGDTNTYTPFCTLRENLGGRSLEAFKKAIPYQQLPATFRDAVDCTRQLGIRYLWIDSICIVQGNGGDFAEEAKKMENVFSGAYCVIAASRAANPHDGFLKTRSQQPFVKFQRDQEEPFYVCKSIDNFGGDVLEGSLNSRGWVLQERALARRTIYFSHNQTYFECGNGIRCETLAQMHNHMARFLGDPKFPNKAMRESSRALRISWFQDLYKQYSRLGFTRVDDKPFAIAGLEKRLQRAFGTEGGFGIFDDGNKPNGGLFHRSLLWRRSEEPGNTKSLRPIEFPAERNIRVPSWSWMAYEGGIEYIDPPFMTAEWETKEIIPPWTRSPKNISSVPQSDDIALTGIVRDFGVAGRGSDEVKLVYDSDRAPTSAGHRPQCIVVARIKGDRAIQDILHYVVLVAPIPATITLGQLAYKRIGVGYMLGKFISLEKTGLLAKIY